MLTAACYKSVAVRGFFTFLHRPNTDQKLILYIEYECNRGVMSLVEPKMLELLQFKTNYFTSYLK